MPKVDWELYAWVVRGSQRRKVLLALEDRMIPTQVKEKTELALNNVSDILRSFEERGLAKCVNPTERVGRLYELTKKGQAIKTKVILLN